MNSHKGAVVLLYIVCPVLFFLLPAKFLAHFFLHLNLIKSTFVNLTPISTLKLGAPGIVSCYLLQLSSPIYLFILGGHSLLWRYLFAALEFFIVLFFLLFFLGLFVMMKLWVFILLFGAVEAFKAFLGFPSNLISLIQKLFYIFGGRNVGGKLKCIHFFPLGYGLPMFLDQSLVSFFLFLLFSS